MLRITVARDTKAYAEFKHAKTFFLEKLVLSSNPLTARKSRMRVTQCS